MSLIFLLNCLSKEQVFSLQQVIYEMKKVTVLLQKKKSCVSTLTNNSIENLNGQIFLTAEHECHS